MKLRQIAQGSFAVSAFLAAVTGLLFLFWAFAESRLPFNDEGRYFDSVEMVVHFEQDVLGYMLIGSLFLLVAAALFWSRKVWRQKEPSQNNRHGMSTKKEI